MLEKTVTVVLADGAGQKLLPLTNERAQAAVPFGGKYRIIDFVLSNCLHSGLRRILVLTQYKSHSLHKHLRDGWSIYNPEIGEYITTVPAQMRSGERWYAGPTDAVFQNLYLLERSGADRVLLLSGEHIYRMDYAAMLRYHMESQADVTVACLAVPREQAKEYAVLQVDGQQRVRQFTNKPKDVPAAPDNPDRALVSLQVFVFRLPLLLEVVRENQQRPDSVHDFHQEILPLLADRCRVQAYFFGGETGRVTPDRYWRDVATVDAFYEANMDLLKPIPPLNLYQNDWPIRTYPGQTPPARTVPGQSGSEGITINSIIGGGTVVAGGSVQESILFSSVFVDDEAMVQQSLLFDGARIGRGCHLNRCIVDKGVIVPDGTEIGVNLEADRRRFSVSEKGVVVIPKYYEFK